MKVDLSASGGLATTARDAREAEEIGCTALWTAETGWDAFLAAVPAIEASTRLEVGTGVVIAFARSPMTIAQEAHDLQVHSGGRFVLGLGSQIKPHITKRFSMPWGRPVAQMREMVGAIRAIFSHWYDGERLDFRGEYYNHTFNAEPFRRVPPPGLAPPPIHLAAVGPRMTALAGEVADGYCSHSFITESYLREVALPQLAQGRARRPESSAPFELVLTASVASGAGEQLEKAIHRARRAISLYGSTPAYRPVLDHHGLGDLHVELNRLTKQERWDEMPGLIDDATLDLFTPVGSPAEVADALVNRFGDLATRLRLPAGETEVARHLARIPQENR